MKPSNQLFEKKIEGEVDSLFLTSLINSLKSGDILKINYAVEALNGKEHAEIFYKISDKHIKNTLQSHFYEGLAKCLESKRFDDFRHLLEFSTMFDIFIEVKKIPNRFEIASKSILMCFQEVSDGYQTASLGKLIEILRFFNEFNLFDKIISKEELNILAKIKRDKLLLLNLKDLFGVVSDSFILYIVRVIPKDLYNFLISRSTEFSYYANPHQIAQYANIFFNRYSIYGLSVEKLGRVRHFLYNFNKNYKLEETNSIENNDLRFIEFYFKNKKHLISPQNIKKNIEKIREKIRDKTDYNFYNLSMVLLGGLGPQGHGFTYSTPKGEIIEICSDIRENDAIIVKYKQFLKKQFLIKLKKEMSIFNIDDITIVKIDDYLSDVLNNRELINYYKKEPILNEIKSFLNTKGNTKQTKYLIEKISNAISIILRPIEMIDQFKCRMNLVAEHKLKSEEIASLTSLKEKSHYDVLRERFFFQYIIKWFYEIYKSKIAES